ncbi:sensor histidine kinase ResE [Bacillaceae bacterium]
MIWKSVVGKLWLTIIGLVAVVLAILSLLLFQLFDSSYSEQQMKDLEALAQKLSFIFQHYPDKEEVVTTAGELVEAYETRLFVVNSDRTQVGHIASSPNVPELPAEFLLEHPQLKKVFQGKKQSLRVSLPLKSEDKRIYRNNEFVVVAVPLYLGPGQTGAVFLYQGLDELKETTNQTKILVLYAAGIAIILTTVFAFFLSTRITQPLRQMKKAADLLAKGKFEGKVDIRSDDEIGDLASTFNHMAARLDELIRAVSHEKEQLSSILRSMADGVITIDAEGRIILTNPPAEKMLQAWHFENEELHPTGEEKREPRKTGVPAPLFSIFQSVLKSEEEVVADIAVQGRIWSVIMGPLYDRNMIRGTVAVLRDVTEERRLDKLRKDFIANVSHELRTPLAMLQGYSEAIIDDIAASPQETKEIAKIIYDETLRMGRLVHDLLDLARMEAGHQELNLNEVDVVFLIEKVMRKFSALAKERGIALRHSVDLPRRSYRLDADRMEQVFTNLIDNAIRHTGEGGLIMISATQKGGELYFHVKDTGSGIPEEDLPFVFERFYKADKARTRGKAGTGLGLAIVKNIVQAHGGSISVHSKVGEGTTFTIQIPVE